MPWRHYAIYLRSLAAGVEKFHRLKQPKWLEIHLYEKSIIMNPPCFENTTIEAISKPKGVNNYIYDLQTWRLHVTFKN